MDLVEHAKDEMKMIHVIRREKEKKNKNALFDATLIGNITRNT